MSITSAAGDSESTALLDPNPPPKIPKDFFHLAYIIYFTLGAGYLLPWNAFITAVDYFDYLYPDASVDRVFAIVYMLVGLTSLLFIVAFAHKWNSVVRINLGYALFLVALLAVPLVDSWYVKGRVGVYSGYYGTVAMVGLCGLADGLVQGSVVGKAGELPERYMQAVVAGTAASEHSTNHTIKWSVQLYARQNHKSKNYQMNSKNAGPHAHGNMGNSRCPRACTWVCGKQQDAKIAGDLPQVMYFCWLAELYLGEVSKKH